MNLGQSINASKWFNLYSFDVMGELGFGKSFNMLESGETHWAIKLLGQGMCLLPYFYIHGCPRELVLTDHY